MIERPPKVSSLGVQNAIELIYKPQYRALLERINEQYLYWSDIKYKTGPDNLSAEEFWTIVVISRQLLAIYKWPHYNVVITVTNYMQRLCHEFDMNFGGSWGNNAIIPNQDREKYLISSIMEEAISSSQIEGASTTRKIAKDMLRRNAIPKTKSEQMIYNNYVAIRYIAEHKDDPMSSDLLLHIHRLMTEKTLENPDDVGRFRTDNDVVVANSITGEVVHYPPAFQEIPNFVRQLSDFVNGEGEGAFIHPIIKAITVHFMIAYVHPFVDGNGRTARAVFYWYMLKKGYWLVEYLSISRIIYKSKASYENSFLYSENDRRDIGYFLYYNLRVLEKAFYELQSYIDRKIKQKQAAVDFLKLGFLNERQATILSMIRDDPKIILSVRELCGKFQVSQPTVKTDIDKLVQRGLLERVVVNGRQYNYLKGEQFDTIIHV